MIFKLWKRMNIRYLIVYIIDLIIDVVLDGLILKIIKYTTEQRDRKSM
jgi:hypothetical protein